MTSALDIPISGTTFGRLTVKGIALKDTYGHRRVSCLCTCGNELAVRITRLYAGSVQSCGCLRRDNGKTKMLTHGCGCRDSETPAYSIWLGMRKRCLNPNCKCYPAYGGRGIRICDRWMSFENFLSDMGERPSVKHSIDRIDVNGNYEPGNCRWVLQAAQARNKRSNKLSEELAIEIRKLASQGVMKKEIARRLHVHYSSVKQVAAGHQWQSLVYVGGAA